MRFKLLISSALLLAMAAPALAQEDYTEFASKEDFFTITFPGKPVQTEGTWITEYGVVLPSKVYTVNETNGSKHVLTVVDYTPVERILAQKANETCPPGAETCLGVGDTGLGYWKNDVRGAATNAIAKVLISQDVRVTHLAFNFMEMVGGQEMQAVNVKDGSRVSASAYMHLNRLVVAVSTTPKGWPEAETLQQSVGWLDENGRAIRYAYMYLNEPDHHAPVIPLRQQAPPPPAGQAAPRPDRIDPAAGR
jgi:hypothetical protein